MPPPLPIDSLDENAMKTVTVVAGGALLIGSMAAMTIAIIGFIGIFRLNVRCLVVVFALQCLSMSHYMVQIFRASDSVLTSLGLIGLEFVLIIATYKLINEISKANP